MSVVLQKSLTLVRGGAQVHELNARWNTFFQYVL